jgi:O-methyltransferase
VAQPAFVTQGSGGSFDRDSPKPERKLKIFRPLIKWTRQGLRALGLDVVRYDALPHDLDPRIARIVRLARPYTMTSLPRLVALCECVRYIVENRIEGDFVECGVWRGGSMMAVASMLLALGDRSRRLYLYDTYDGMTQPTEKDIEFSGKRAETLLASSDKADEASVWCYAPLEAVKKVVLGTGYDPSKVNFVQGRVEDTIPGVAPERIALLRLDTDWYESTRHELVHLYPRLVTGGVLIIDDYGHWLGARQAVDEYLSRHELPLMLHRIDYSGRCAIKWERGSGPSNA